MTCQAANGPPELKAQFAPELDQLAADTDMSDEIRALAGVLKQILAGKADPDLSALPEKLAQLVRSATTE